MFRLVTLVLLALLAACSSVTRTEPQSSSTAANQPPPDCARYEPDTPEKQKCLEQAQPVSKGMATAILAGGMASILVGTAVMALSDEHAKADIVRIGTLDNGLALYRGNEQQSIGVIAQEVRPPMRSPAVPMDTCMSTTAWPTSDDLGVLADRRICLSATTVRYGRGVACGCALERAEAAEPADWAKAH